MNPYNSGFRIYIARVTGIQHLFIFIFLKMFGILSQLRGHSVCEILCDEHWVSYIHQIVFMGCKKRRGLADIILSISVLSSHTSELNLEQPEATVFETVHADYHDIVFKDSGKFSAF